MKVQQPCPRTVEIEDVDQESFLKREDLDHDADLELTLHKLLTQGHQESTAVSEAHQHDLAEGSYEFENAIEKAITEMEMPDLHEESRESRMGSTVAEQSINSLTVENILKETMLHGIPLLPQKRTFEDSHGQGQMQQGIRKTGTLYESLSPESLSPFSDNGSLERLKKDGKDVMSGSKSVARGMKVSPSAETKRIGDTHQEIVGEGTRPMTKEFLAAQVAETKRRMISTHKLLLNFNFLRDAYAKSCIDLKKSVTKLKESECRRAHLLQENEQLKSLVIQLSQKANRTQV
ncbi:LAMI_0H18470g1_1 [Lachancea mirantina]|uniref:LAMI_0H18470g1_1 n=1 Tax=Lachancea mirantina TaxID=1230905 RepID=A0A1G4KJI0_9SACH|nr:LAMI_0H18470g1_1 [Lachancea mirantina]